MISCPQEGGHRMKTRLKDLREDHDLTQAALAARLGITQRKYSYLETETQPLTDEMIVKICRVFGISSDYLLYLSDKQ